MPTISEIYPFPEEKPKEPTTRELAKEGLTDRKPLRKPWESTGGRPRSRKKINEGEY